MYAGCKTSVMTSAGNTKGIEIEVGLHQGSSLGPLLFVIIIDVITEEIEEGTPWAVLFADELVLCVPDREMMELRPCSHHSFGTGTVPERNRAPVFTPVPLRPVVPERADHLAM